MNTCSYSAGSEQKLMTASRSSGLFVLCLPRVVCFVSARLPKNCNYSLRSYEDRPESSILQGHNAIMRINANAFASGFISFIVAGQPILDYAGLQTQTSMTIAWNLAGGVQISSPRSFLLQSNTIVY